MTDLPTRLSASQVSLVLQRAAEIDAKGDSLTVDELRHIADEAGIDPDATEKALRLVLADEDPDPKPAPAASPGAPARKAPSLSPWRIGTGGSIGFALGFIGAFAGFAGGMIPGVFPGAYPGDPGALAILAGLGLVGTAVYLIVRTVDCIKRGAQLDFQLQNFTLWLGTAVGAVATDLYVFADDLIGVISAIWFVTSVVGGLLVRFAPRHKESEP